MAFAVNRYTSDLVITHS